jgi:hypothetical protein
MPTPFAIIVLGLMAVGFLVGIVFWVRAAQRRSHPPQPTVSTHPEAPWGAERSAEAHHKGGVGGPSSGMGG